MVTSNHAAKMKWLGVMVVGAGGCLAGGPTLPALPGTGGTEGPTGGGVTSEAGVTVAATEATSATDTNAGGIIGETTSATGADEGSTGPVAVCGNGVVEDGEACDGMDWAGASCEGLGYTAGTLACSECGFDASDCGAPVGMVRVPGGVFEMGSESGNYAAPVRLVHVDTFFIDRTEVTVAAYAECVSAGPCDAPYMSKGFANNYWYGGRENHPINLVSWYDAVDYCEWVDGGMKKRLPTEAEWEKAARGTDARAWPWGDAPLSCTYAVYMLSQPQPGCGLGSTAEVQSRPAGVSPYGAHDMAGNVAEWVSDWWSESYDSEEVENPIGPLRGEYRVMRGGDWASPEVSDVHRTYQRALRGPDGGAEYSGFRCVRDPI